MRKEKKMKLGHLKDKIRAILGAEKETEINDENLIIDSAQRKAALIGKFIEKTSQTPLYKNGELDISKLPCDFISAASERRYYAFPEQITETTDDETELGYDGEAADIVSYGAAMELCGRIYPGDIRKYMRIATEYDERVAAVCQKNVSRVGNGMFGGRGIRR